MNNITHLNERTALGGNKLIKVICQHGLYEPYDLNSYIMTKCVST